MRKQIFLTLCTTLESFIYDGMVIKGNKENVIDRFINENPSKKLRTWLIDKNLVISEISKNI